MEAGLARRLAELGDVGACDEGASGADDHHGGDAVVGQRAYAALINQYLTQNGGTILRDQAGTTTVGAAATAGSDVYTVAGGAVIQLNAGAANSVAFSACA